MVLVEEEEVNFVEKLAKELEEIGKIEGLTPKQKAIKEGEACYRVYKEFDESLNRKMRKNII